MRKEQSCSYDSEKMKNLITSVRGKQFSSTQVKLQHTGCLQCNLRSNSGGRGRGFCNPNCQPTQNQTIQNNPFNLQSLLQQWSSPQGIKYFQEWPSPPRSRFPLLFNPLLLKFEKVRHATLGWKKANSWVDPFPSAPLTGTFRKTHLPCETAASFLVRFWQRRNNS